MNAANLVKAICLCNQKKLGKEGLPCPLKFLDELYKGLVKQSRIEVTPVSIKIVQDCENPLGLEQLQKEVEKGYWVYSFYCSVDFHDFEWCASKDHALRFYESLATQPFCGDRLILFVNETEIMPCLK